MKRTINLPLLLAFLLTGCSDSLPSSTPEEAQDMGMEIQIGGIETDEPVVEVATRAATATPGEKVDWLRQPLFDGLDITYYAKSKPETKMVAELKLKPATNAGESNPPYELSSDGQNAVYTFYYKVNGSETTKKAQWLDNAAHRFEGVYVPPTLISEEGTSPQTPNDLTINQTGQNAEDNYTLLTRYLSMPADYDIMATVGYVRLPFHHRLARVLAFVLIDPSMTGVKIKDFDDTGKTPAISFENVKVLEKVEKKEVDGRTTYTPRWAEARKVTPHYMGEYGSINNSLVNRTGYENRFVVYRHKTKKSYLYPTQEGWESAAADPENYEKIEYGKVPCFDLIVRPTYRTVSQVMYDEDFSTTTAAAYAAEKNQIDFVVELSNGLKYTKNFQFDLDANYQTVVYLRIDREQVDYSASGSELWVANYGKDGYYGVDNENDLRLSKAGGSWQRAYRIGTSSWDYTDGADYKDNQYLSEEEWIKRFKNAVIPPSTPASDENRHGDYFVLEQNIAISGLPDDFVFTGHLDARGHTITVSDERGYLFDGLNGNYDTAQESDQSQEWEANVHLENGTWVPVKNETSGYRAELLNLTVKDGTLFKASPAENPITHTGHVYNCKDTNGNVPNQIPEMP